MGDYGIKISKAGTDVKGTPAETTKKNYVILSTDSVHKVSGQGVTSSDTNVSHGLGFAPMFDAYTLESSLTEAHPIDFETSYRVTSDSTYLYCDELYGSDSLFYVIYLDQP